MYEHFRAVVTRCSIAKRHTNVSGRPGFGSRLSGGPSSRLFSAMIHIPPSTRSPSECAPQPREYRCRPSTRCCTSLLSSDWCGRWTCLGRCGSILTLSTTFTWPARAVGESSTLRCLIRWLAFFRARRQRPVRGPHGSTSSFTEHARCVCRNPDRAASAGAVGYIAEEVI